MSTYKTLVSLAIMEVTTDGKTELTLDVRTTDPNGRISQSQLDAAALALVGHCVRRADGDSQHYEPINERRAVIAYPHVIGPPDPSRVHPPTAWGAVDDLDPTDGGRAFVAAHHSDETDERRIGAPDGFTADSTTMPDEAPAFADAVPDSAHIRAAARSLRAAADMQTQNIPTKGKTLAESDPAFAAKHNLPGYDRPTLDTAGLARDHSIGGVRFADGLPGHEAETLIDLLTHAGVEHSRYKLAEWIVRMWAPEIVEAARLWASDQILLASDNEIENPAPAPQVVLDMLEGVGVWIEPASGVYRLVSHEDDFALSSSLPLTALQRCVGDVGDDAAPAAREYLASCGVS